MIKSFDKSLFDPVLKSWLCTSKFVCNFLAAMARHYFFKFPIAENEIHFFRVNYFRDLLVAKFIAKMHGFWGAATDVH